MFGSRLDDLSQTLTTWRAYQAGEYDPRSETSEFFPFLHVHHPQDSGSMSVNSSGMDLQHLLCGLSIDRLRNTGFFRIGNQLGNLQLPRPPSINFPNLNLPNIPRPEWNINLPNINLPNINLPDLPALKHRYGAAVYNKNGSTSRKHLPVGSGPHTVGCLDLMFDLTASGTFVRLYYPTQPTDVFKREAQWPLWLPRKQYGKGYAYFRRKNTKMYGTLINIIGGDVYVPVLWQAPVLDNNEKFPLIIFSHGLGGNRTTYTTICSDLASHGYIVAAMEHRDGTASMTYCFRPMSSFNDDSAVESENANNDDFLFHRNHSFREEKWLKYARQEFEDDFDVRNKQVHLRVEEIQRVLGQLEALDRGEDIKNVLGLQLDISQFKGRIDFNRLAIIGHSFGGATTVATLAADKRFKLGVALDAWMHPLSDHHYERISQPVLFINNDTFQWNSNVRAMYKLEPNDNNKHGHLHRVLITLKGACHQTQTDFQFMIPAKVGKILGMRHNTESFVAMDINQRATLGFLSKHLNIPDQDHHEDILTGQHALVIRGTDLDLTKDERLPPTH